MDLDKLEPIVIATLFASGEPITLETLATILEYDKDILKIELDCMIDDSIKKDGGIIIKKINNSYQLASNPNFFEYTKKLFEPRQKQGLPQAAMETLSIVAYNPGITRAEIEKIRGVNSDSSINSLIERNLIKDVGRLEAPGRPIIYETTDEFLKCFGYTSLEDLPKIDLEENKEEDKNDNK